MKVKICFEHQNDNPVGDEPGEAGAGGVWDVGAGPAADPFACQTFAENEKNASHCKRLLQNTK